MDRSLFVEGRSFEASEDWRGVGRGVVGSERLVEGGLDGSVTWKSVTGGVRLGGVKVFIGSEASGDRRSIGRGVAGSGEVEGRFNDFICGRTVTGVVYEAGVGICIGGRSVIVGVEEGGVTAV